MHRVLATRIPLPAAHHIQRDLRNTLLSMHISIVTHRIQLSYTKIRRRSIFKKKHLRNFPATRRSSSISFKFTASPRKPITLPYVGDQHVDVAKNNMPTHNCHVYIRFSLCLSVRAETYEHRHASLHIRVICYIRE